MSVAEAYGPDRMGRAFGWRPGPGQPNPYTISGYHRGQDVRKTDPTGSYSVVTDVVSLSAGVVSHLYTGKSTGREVVVDTGRKVGRYEIHCHNAPGAVAKGARVGAGGWLARNATAKQKPGTAWSAPHDHFMISDYPDAAHENRPVYDPRPFIAAALAQTAGGGTTPFPTPQEDTLSAAEVAEIKAHITTESQAARRLAAGTPGAGARLVRYAKSAATGTVFALYDNPAGGRFRVPVTDPTGVEDAATVPQETLWGYAETGVAGGEWPHDGVTVRPGALTGYATSDATGNVFALYVDSNGNRARRLLDRLPAGATAPTVKQAVLWTYAPVNQS
ncbi:hypothetical protein [Microbacterium sp. CH-015]|uniref:hypothetical protein n=1 Tax=Microbacterium sp. CH-015 TaxID=3406734 RepID=UPI003C770865